MLLPEVLSIRTQKTELTQVILSLYIPKQLEYFDGHFPNQPILPGVVQVHWAIHFAREELGVTGQVLRLEKIKFHSVILPDSHLALSLQWNEEKLYLDSLYTTNQKKYSAGRIVYNNELAEANEF
tara:strand:- start:13583 stop:13957 length:375 start_codon:yes stop_codon:yes gene_type:complete